MSETWKVIDTGISHAEKNMEIDIALLEGLASKERTPILHLYEWEKPSATFGHFIDPYHHLQAEALTEGFLQIARRPTGGGIIFHVTDMAFSILIPAGHPDYSTNVLDNYASVNTLVIAAISSFMGTSSGFSLLPDEAAAQDANTQYFCMAKPTKYDVMFKGSKVGGAAQRRTKFGFLHQGSISLALPDDEFLKKVLLPGTSILAAMQTHTCVLLESKPSLKSLAEARHALRSHLISILQN